MKNSTQNSKEYSRLKRDEFLKEAAQLIARRSTCLRLQVGALVARDGRILVTGYNGAPSGLPHCTPKNCNPDEPCTRAVHAEANCIAFAAKHGISLQEAVMYTTDSPCMECAKLIINAGIVSLHYQRDYRDPKPVDLLASVGVLIL